MRWTRSTRTTGVPTTGPLEREVRIVNRSGLHARPCHAIVSTAMRFQSTLRVRVGSSAGDVNGKSILELMTLEASEGTDLRFSAEGDDATGLLDELEALVAGGFGE